MSGACTPQGDDRAPLQLSRRAWLKAGGALVVSFSVPSTVRRR